MKPDKDQMETFIKAIRLKEFAFIGDIFRSDNMVSITLTDFEASAKEVVQQIADIFNLETFETEDNIGHTCYMINMPGYGSFGIRKMWSHYIEDYKYHFIIKDKCYCNQMQD